MEVHHHSVHLARSAPVKDNKEKLIDIYKLQYTHGVAKLGCCVCIVPCAYLAYSEEHGGNTLIFTVFYTLDSQRAKLYLFIQYCWPKTRIILKRVEEFKCG